MAEHARSLEPVRRLTGGTDVQCSRDDAPAWPQVPHRRPPVQPSKQSHSTVKKRPNAALCAICTEVDTCFIAGDAMKLLFRASEEAAASPALCACEGEKYSQGGFKSFVCVGDETTFNFSSEAIISPTSCGACEPDYEAQASSAASRGCVAGCGRTGGHVAGGGSSG